ncbi:hypothetical protein ACFV4F_35270 [Kitasatospora sp. NPDC059722]|uniref:hypothetical protein n=1 Tax=Kitasatospora sp. NPDC059722 TaxID=3346925 RepID=UPI00369642E2
MNEAPARSPRRYLGRAAIGAAATVLLAAAGTVAATADTTPAATAKPQVATPHWEYRWALAQPGGKTVGDLEKLGKEGWEVVAPVNPYTGDRWNFLLKRQLPE